MRILLAAVMALGFAVPAAAQTAAPTAAKPPAAAPQAEKPTQPAVAWTYGQHPLWGMSAWVTAGEHSVGMRCLPPSNQLGPVFAMLFTPGLVQTTPNGASINYKLVGTRGEGGYTVGKKNGYFEGEGSTCGLSVHEMLKGKTLVLDDGAEKPKVLGRVPLSGAKAAVQKLMAACPAMKRDFESCGD
jgi:hypothetical protein